MTQPTSARSGLISAVLVCAVVGVTTVAATVSRGRATDSASTGMPDIATEDYGRRLIAETSALLGPDHPDPAMRYSGSRLACASCHLGAGTEPGTLTLLQTLEHYPRFSARAGAMTDIEDRINECMQRSMNGRPLPFESAEMKAVAAYLRSLGRRYAAMGESLRTVVEPEPFKTPDRAASLEAGKTVFDARCAACHGGNGLGLRASASPADGYVFPPLWGPDSFNNGAGMNRVLTAARFIKARMPLGQADLTSDEAFDVAAYLSSQPRPQMANLDQDYPDRTKKPVDNGYGPFTDPFPLEQHRFGPFAPIAAYYAEQKPKE
jgi:thiosulfate dehydrogenase